MDHKEQHHQKHEKEREEKKKEQKAHDLEEMKRATGIHPGWFLAIGIVLIGLIVLVWTLST